MLYGHPADPRDCRGFFQLPKQGCAGCIQVGHRPKVNGQLFTLDACDLPVQVLPGRRNGPGIHPAGQAEPGVAFFLRQGVGKVVYGLL
mgnify:CR=1 FL=1